MGTPTFAERENFLAEGVGENSEGVAASRHWLRREQGGFYWLFETDGHEGGQTGSDLNSCHWLRREQGRLYWLFETDGHEGGQIDSDPDRCHRREQGGLYWLFEMGGYKCGQMDSDLHPGHRPSDFYCSWKWTDIHAERLVRSYKDELL